MMEDPYRPLVEAYALGALDAEESRAWRRHAAGCPECLRELTACEELGSKLSLTVPQVEPDPTTREQLLELAEGERLSTDLDRYAWEETVPGVNVHVVKEDPGRGLRACLVWARAGAKHPRHRHTAAEVILVLRGRIRDERGTYGPGEVCRSKAGSVHSEQAEPAEDCLCYVLYYGPLEMMPDPVESPRGA